MASARTSAPATKTNPKSNRGASEIKQGKLKNGKQIHRHHRTVARQPGRRLHRAERRQGQGAVGPPRHRRAAALGPRRLRSPTSTATATTNSSSACATIPNKTRKFTERRGVRIYKALDDDGRKWQRQIIDNGGIAVEDLAAADLNGDGKIDIVAVGRADAQRAHLLERNQEVSRRAEPRKGPVTVRGCRHRPLSGLGSPWHYDTSWKNSSSRSCCPCRSRSSSSVPAA